MTLVSAAVEESIRKLPDRPGIYIFRGEKRKPLYVGKAKSLRRRGANYLRTDFEPRLANMLRESIQLDYLIADSEAEALALENNWIKQKKPRYNIRLRDDKTYPYLKLTLDEKWPRIVFTRRIFDDGSEYYGPFVPAGLARKAIKLVQKLFGVRAYRIPVEGALERPCLYHDVYRDLGPCPSELTDLESYRGNVEQARLFLKGRNGQLIRDLRRKMLEASEQLEFERAAKLRDLLHEVEEISQRRKISSVRGEDHDIYGLYSLGGSVSLTVLVMRGGQILDRRELFWEGRPEDQTEASALLTEVLPQIYDVTTFIPKEIHLPAPIEDEDVLVDWLSEKKGERVYVRMPSRGPKADRVALATRNAKLAFRRRFRAEDRGALAARALMQHLALPEPPSRIEGFDISHFQGAQTVASMVVWEAGKMRKGEYRSFNIRDLDQPDDYFAMHQAVERRYRRVLEEVGVMPDVIMIDGGRGQLNAALEALALLGVEETAVVGLAKQQEEIFLPGEPQPLLLPREDPGLQALQQVRDEAHRFAVSRHRTQRKGRTLRSRLDEVPGIGPKRRKLLLTRFGSLAGVQQASNRELSEALGAKTGKAVFEALRGDLGSGSEAAAAESSTSETSAAESSTSEIQTAG
ncbi:MAG: excinuclease ABC subunit UvrC [Acidobacteriota bacterium]